MEKTKRKVKRTPFRAVKLNLKKLSYDELDQILALAKHYRKEKLGDEELRLIKEKEEVELRLKNLKKVDGKVNML